MSFTYQIYQHNRRTRHFDVVSFDAPLPYDDGPFGLFIVEVLSVPLIHGEEALTVDDLIEFCTHVQMQCDVPDSLLAPRAVQRFLTSKACRSSLKFGQFMEQQEMNLLLSRWQQTRLLFHVHMAAQVQYHCWT
jgi:DNA mismatch repair ATPase MutL